VPIAEVTLPDRAAAGLFGKIPSRGDFVRLGLPRGFVQPWDDWLQHVIAGSRAQLGEAWLPAWMEAPIWYFALPAGMCGGDRVLGLWMPSVDRAGRHFPLTLALVLSGDAATSEGGAWLARAEAAGLEALRDALPPEVLAARLQGGGAAIEAQAVALPDLGPLNAGQAVWWTEGSPFVPDGVRLLAALPGIDDFTMMLDATSATASCPMDSDDADRPDGVEGT